MKLDSISYKQDGTSLVGLAVALSKNCRSPLYEAKNHKKSYTRPVTVDVSKTSITKIGLKVSTDQGDDSDVFYGIRVFKGEFAVIN